MGRKPLFALAGVCLAGAVLCGCSGRQTYNNRPSMPSPQTRVPGAPTPSPGSVTNATGWDNAPAKNVGSPVNPSDLGSKPGSGMGASDLRAPGGSLTAGPGALPSGASSSPPSWNTSPGMGSRTPSSLGGMPPAGSTGGLNGMPPAPPGDPTGAGLGSGGSPSPLAPPPPPAPRPGAGNGFGQGSDPGAGLSGQPTGMNQSRMDGGYRTVPPGVPEMPSAVPTMPTRTLEP